MAREGRVRVLEFGVRGGGGGMLIWAALSTVTLQRYTGILVLEIFKQKK